MKTSKEILRELQNEYRYDLLKVHIKHSGDWRESPHNDESESWYSAPWSDAELKVTHTQLIVWGDNGIALVVNFQNASDTQIFWKLQQFCRKNELIEK